MSRDTELVLVFDYPAIEGETTKIAQLSIGGIPAPVENTSTSFTISKITGLKNCSFVSRTWINKKTNENYYGANFEGQTEYRLKLSLRPYEGFEFIIDPSSSWTLEGGTFVKAEINSKLLIDLYFDFPKTGGIKPIIDELYLGGISAPVTGESTLRNDERITGLDFCTLDTKLVSAWYVDTLDNKFVVWDMQGVFEGEKVYSLFLRIEANAGTKFDTTSKDKNKWQLEGATTNYLNILEDVVTIGFTFPATSPDTSPIQISDSMPNLGECFIGEEFGLNVSDYVSGGVAPYEYSIVTDVPWLTIDPVTGYIHGTPTKAYYSKPAATAILKVEDSNGNVKKHTIFLEAIVKKIVDYSIEFEGLENIPVIGDEVNRGFIKSQYHAYYSIEGHNTNWFTSLDSSIYDGNTFLNGKDYYLKVCICHSNDWAFPDDLSDNSFELIIGDEKITSCKVS